MIYNSIRTSLLISTLYIIFLGWAQSPLIAIPGTTISMTPPDGYTLSSSFSGFENLNSQSSILIVEMPLSSYSDLSPIFSDLEMAKEAFATRGVTITALEEVLINKIATPVLSGTQVAAGTEITKYISIINSDPLVMITFNIFPSEDLLSKEEAISTLQSIIFGSVKTLDEKLDTLPFNFEILEPFETSDVLAGSTVLITTFEGVDTTGKLPLLVIGTSLSQISLSNKKAAAEQISLSIPGFENAQITTIEPTNFAENSGYKSELLMDDEVAIHYISFFDNNTYIRLIATGGQKEIKLLKDTIDKIAMSVQFKE